MVFGKGLTMQTINVLGENLIAFPSDFHSKIDTDLQYCKNDPNDELIQ